MGLILLRYGELALKGANRPFFIRKLRQNVRACLKQNGIMGQVEAVGSRLYVSTDQVDEALAPLQRVFGLVSLSPAREVPRSLEGMAAEAVRVAAHSGLSPEGSFRIEARRADKSFPYSSPEIGREVGAAVVQATGARVDLSPAADLTIGIEVTRDRTLVFGEVYPGPGGLPLGVAGRAVALMSGGIDSPVAAWMMMKRGCHLIPLHFRQSEIETQKCLENCRVLESWSYGWKMRPVILEQEEVFAPVFRRLQELGEERWTCLICKRSMLVTAADLAEQHRAAAIVSGDSLGQVASQTLDNLGVISFGVEVPILRPLIGLDKVEITDLARRIGTFEVSIRESAPCAYLPRRPLTRGRIEALRDLLDRLEASEVSETLEA